ncbi:MAG: ROK family protein, partial [Oscillospiraceae bacterium]|nr:ROK family protein [Oscillospiraceae bacterium]
MLSDLICAAAQGETLWVPELRAAFASDPDNSKLILRLRLIHGEVRDYPLCLPRWSTSKEQHFVAEFLYANIYNLLSVCSGRELCLYFDPEDKALMSLVQTLEDVFQIHRPNRCSYGKVINIADRLCAAEGYAPFRFSVAALQDYGPARQEPNEATDAPLAVRLQHLCCAAESPVLCGIDIGGTDIKLCLSVNGRLICTGEYDWNPAASATADGILLPIAEQVSLLRTKAAQTLGLSEPPLLDAVGVSFPDIVLGDRILGGETPKTDGLRRNPALDYEQEFRKLSGLKELLLQQCRSGASVHIINDGHMAAFTAAMELSAEETPTVLQGGLIAHTLGTDLGTGWLQCDGSIPPFPLELYDLILDVGNLPASSVPPEDLRSIRNENSGLPGARRYLGQSAAFRVAQELDPALLQEFTMEEGGRLQIRTKPEDFRKPCLEHLMQEAAAGHPAASEVFR